MMAGDEFDGTRVEQARSGGTSQRVGWYVFYFADERWNGRPRSKSSTATSR
jgi:hypothetical protein